jgi:hypothetical protein
MDDDSNASSDVVVVVATPEERRNRCWMNGKGDIRSDFDKFLQLAGTLLRGQELSKLVVQADFTI